MSIYELQVYKAMSKSKVNKSTKQNFIKVVLAKDQR